MLFNIYTSDLPETTYVYADDIALGISARNLCQYFNEWRLKVNLSKTVCSSFHLDNRHARDTINVMCNGDSALALAYAPAEYCAPGLVWKQSHL